MHAALFLLMSAALGVDVGWQPLEDGGFEYIIQLEPQALESLRKGDELRSDIPPFLRDVRSYRIRAGTGELPRIGSPPPAAAQPAPSEAAAQPSATSSAAEPPSSTSPVDAADKPPRILQPDPSSTELVGHESSYREGSSENDAAGPSEDKLAADDVASPRKREANERWWPLTGALLMLFVSVGGNAYLGMQWWSVRQRCRTLVRQLRSGHNAAEASSSTGSDINDDDEDADVRIVN